MSEIFVSVTTSQELIAALSSFSEDDLIRYDRSSRTELCDEIKKLCKGLKVTVPQYCVNLAKNQDRYDAQAEVRGIEPTSLIDEINFEVDGDFKDLHSFGKWLSALDAADDQLENAKALVEPEDAEMSAFLETEEVKQ